jgi:hypothetical protein
MGASGGPDGGRGAKAEAERSSLTRRVSEAGALPPGTMTWQGLRYTRVWSQHAAARGGAGGGFDVPVERVMALAARATSIHIRVHGDETDALTLRPGVVWPLEQLRRGLPFDTTLHGVDVTPQIARVTWHGPSSVVDRMWNRGARTNSQFGRTLEDGRLYLGCGNPNGLRLIAGRHCEFASGQQTTPVEVWIGEPP